MPTMKYHREAGCPPPFIRRFASIAGDDPVQTIGAGRRDGVLPATPARGILHDDFQSIIYRR